MSYAHISQITNMRDDESDVKGSTLLQKTLDEFAYWSHHAYAFMMERLGSDCDLASGLVFDPKSHFKIFKEHCQMQVNFHSKPGICLNIYLDGYTPIKIYRDEYVRFIFDKDEDIAVTFTFYKDFRLNKWGK